MTVASYEKIIKTIIEKFQNSLSPLGQLGEITRNQEILIDQTQQIIDLLKREYTGREEQAEPLKNPAESPCTTEIESDV